MLNNTRGPGAIEASSELVSLLERLCWQRQILSEPILILDSVRHVEIALGLRFEPDLLLVFATRALQEEGMLLEKVVAHTAALREQVPGDWIGLAKKEDVFWGIRHGQQQQSLVSEIVEGEMLSELPLNKRLSLLLKSDGSEKSPIRNPRLVLKPLESSASVGGEVFHPKFGHGKILARHERGSNSTKVKVAFDTHGLKLLEERFLKKVEK